MTRAREQPVKTVTVPVPDGSLLDTVVYVRHGDLGFMARFTRWAFDHPWRYATLFTCTWCATWILSSVAFGSAPVSVAVAGVLIGFLPSLLLMHWLCARASWRSRPEPAPDEGSRPNAPVWAVRAGLNGARDGWHNRAATEQPNSERCSLSRDPGGLHDGCGQRRTDPVRLRRHLRR
jgi:hypothetical protein